MGRPRGSYNKDKPVASVLRLKLLGENRNKLHAIVDSWIEAAKNGDLQALERIADRIDGKVPSAAARADDVPLKLIGRVEHVIIDPKLPEGERDRLVDIERRQAESVHSPAVSGEV